jgi:peptidoglycan/LPS O-acetylase OafA/YrhL
LHELAGFGWCGVNLFFVLSGFLITGILLDTKGAPNYFTAFYARRVLRIFPLYYLVLTTILLIASTSVGLTLNSVLPPSKDRWAYFVYLSNWQWRDVGNIIGHFWSLAVEEQFYLFWPLLIWLMPTRVILPLGMAGMVLSLGLRLFVFYTHGDVPRMLHGTFTVGLDPLLAGASIAYIVRQPKLVILLTPWIYSLGGAGCAVLAVFAASGKTLSFSPLHLCWIMTCLSIMFGSLVYRAFNSADQAGWMERALRHPFLASFGKLSYGIYVYHVPILVISLHFVGTALGIGKNVASSILYSLAFVAFVFSLAGISYHLLERPFLSLKRYFEPSLGGLPMSLASSEEPRPVPSFQAASRVRTRN